MKKAQNSTPECPSATTDTISTNAQLTLNPTKSIYAALIAATLSSCGGKVTSDENFGENIPVPQSAKGGSDQGGSNSAGLPNVGGNSGFSGEPGQAGSPSNGSAAGQAGENGQAGKPPIPELAANEVYLKPSANKTSYSLAYPAANIALNCVDIVNGPSDKRLSTVAYLMTGLFSVSALKGTFQNFNFYPAVAARGEFNFLYSDNSPVNLSANRITPTIPINSFLPANQTTTFCINADIIGDSFLSTGIQTSNLTEVSIVSESGDQLTKILGDFPIPGSDILFSFIEELNPSNFTISNSGSIPIIQGPKQQKLSQFQITNNSTFDISMHGLRLDIISDCQPKSADSPIFNQPILSDANGKTVFSFSEPVARYNGDSSFVLRAQNGESARKILKRQSQEFYLNSSNFNVQKQCAVHFCLQSNQGILLKDQIYGSNLGVTNDFQCQASQWSTVVIQAD